MFSNIFKVAKLIYFNKTHNLAWHMIRAPSARGCGKPMLALSVSVQLWLSSLCIFVLPLYVVCVQQIEMYSINSNMLLCLFLVFIMNYLYNRVRLETINSVVFLCFACANANINFSVVCKSFLF